MKKLLIALLTLSVVGAVFAADPAPTVAFSGYFNTGLRLDIVEGVVNADGDDAMLLKLHGRDAGKDGYRFRLNGAFTLESAGINFRLHSEGDKLKLDGATESRTNVVALAFGYAWVDLADKMFKVKAGLIDDGAWATKGDIGGDFSDQKGVQVQFTGVENLNAGFGVFAKDSFGGTSEFDKSIFVLGGAYTVPSLVGFQANAQMDNSHDATESVALQKILVGANLLSVKDLTAAVEFQMEKMAGEDVALTTISQKFAYKMGAIDMGLVAYEWMSAVEDSVLGFKVNPWVSYTSGKHVPKLSVTYLSNEKAGAANEDAVVTKLTINPSYAYNATSKAKIVAGFAYDMITETKDFEEDNNATCVYVDFVWSF